MHAICAKPSPFLDDLDLDDEWEDFHAKIESMGEQSDKLDSEGEELDSDIEETAMAIIVPVDADTSSTTCTEVYDLGASHHICPYKDNFLSYTPLSPLLYFNAASQHKFPAIGMGTLVLRTLNSGCKSKLVLLHALHAPSVSYTLVSLGQLDKEGFMSVIRNRRLHITSPCTETVAEIPCNSRRLYKVIHIPESTYAMELISAMELHRHLGHISVASARKLVQSGAIKGVKLDPDAPNTDCKVCIIACATHLPMSKPHVSVLAQSFRDVIHTDVWGPESIQTTKKACYFITFTDDVTCFTIVYLLKTKGKVLRSYKLFEAWATAQQHCTSIKVLHSNHGGEYLSKDFDKHLAAAGTAQCLTTHDTPQLNGIAEQLNQMLLEHTHALCYNTGLPKMLWGEALHHATWLKNQMATWALDTKMPYKVLYKTLPDLSALHLWGCKVWVHDDTGSKINIRVYKGHWLSFDTDAWAHRIYWTKPSTVGLKWNIYFASAGPLEGEDLQINPIGSK